MVEALINCGGKFITRHTKFTGSDAHSQSFLDIGDTTLKNQPADSGNLFNSLNRENRPDGTTKEDDSLRRFARCRDDRLYIIEELAELE